MFERQLLFVGNEWVEPSGPGQIEVVSPSTEEVVGRVPRVHSADLDRAVSAARSAFDSGPWPHLTVAERGEFLTRVSELLIPRIDELVQLQIDEMGTPDVYIRPITDWLIRGIPNQVSVLADFPFREVRDGYAGKVLVVKDPVGVIGTVIPWNVPVPGIINKAVTPLLLGCPVVIKPAEESPLSAYVVAEAFHEAGLPAGTLSILPAGAEIGERLISHPGVDRASFTGSAAVGARVGAICGEQIKPVLLELGGKSAAVLLEDVDLDRYLPSLIENSMPNSGQVCLATTRILAPRSRYDEVVTKVSEAIGSLKVGDPHDPEVTVGPLVTQRQRDRVESYIRSGIEQGARLVVGGAQDQLPSAGWFVRPTVFADVDSSMKIAQDEIFGPVLTILPYSSEDEAVAIANDSIYGLGGAVYGDPDRAFAVALRIDTGTCSVNDGPPGGGGGPFGGYKHSGLGREGGPEGRCGLPGDQVGGATGWL